MTFHHAKFTLSLQPTEIFPDLDSAIWAFVCPFSLFYHLLLLYAPFMSSSGSLAYTGKNRVEGRAPWQPLKTFTDWPCCTYYPHSAAVIHPGGNPLQALTAIHHVLNSQERPSAVSWEATWYGRKGQTDPNLNLSSTTWASHLASNRLSFSGIEWRLSLLVHKLVKIKTMYMRYPAHSRNWVNDRFLPSPHQCLSSSTGH